MKKKFSHTIRVLFAAILLLSGISPVMSTLAYAQGAPDFGINLSGNFVNGWGWPSGELVTLTIDDLETSESPDFIDTQYPDISPDDPVPYVDFSVNIPLKLGYVVEMSNNNTTVAHIVDFEVDKVSLLFDQVVGRALPGTEVEVRMSAYDGSMLGLRRVAADASGAWIADFSQIGTGPGEINLVDFANPDKSIFIESTDQNLGTYYAQSIPVPFLNVFLDREVSVWDIRSPWWPKNTAVTLKIDDPDTSQSPDFTETRNTRMHPRYPSIYRVDFYLDGFQIKPGMIATVTDGFTAIKEHIVMSLQVTEVDTTNDIVCGLGAPDTDTQVEVDTADYTAVRHVLADHNGYWCADFSEPGPNVDEGDLADIIPDSEGLALQRDNDGDSSVKVFIASSGPDIDGDGIPDLDDPCPADPTDACNADGSTAATVGTDGGLLVTENQAVSMEVPPSALPEALTLSITDAGGGYVLSDAGQAMSVLSVDIEPSGTIFAEPVTMVFQWPDENDDGIVDNTTLPESALVIIKDGVVITEPCWKVLGCNTGENTFTFQVSSLSTFALSAFPAPKIVSFNATAEPVRIGALVSTSASIHDVEQGDSYTLTWDWGDGTQETQLGLTGNEFQATHTYVDAGVYSVTLTVDEGEDGSDSATFEYVVVYDPEGGFVTGGGWITSPTGACRYAECVDDTTGMANFGFVSKYKKGANVPTGNTEFNFKAGGLNFKSTSYQWLVVAGSKAMYKGVGAINGTGSYGFMITAIDSALSRSTSIDLFRIKIWEIQTGVVVYDNQMDAPEDADPTTAIGGGSIVIHK
jgi:PKD repeat protein